MAPTNDNSLYRDGQFRKFSAYGFLKNLKFFEPFFILYLLSQGVNYLQIGTLYAIREVAINVLEIPTGVFADSWGRKKTMLLSFISYIVSFLILYFFQSFFLLALAMVFYGFGDACRTGTHKAMIFDYINDKGWGDIKSWYYGKTRAWSQRGSALSALAAGFLVFWRGDYGAAFLFAIIPYVLDFFLILSYPAYLDKSSGRGGPSEQVKLAGAFRLVVMGLVRTLKAPGALGQTANVALFAGFYKAVKDFLQPVLKMAALALPFMAARGEEERSGIVIGLVYMIIYLMTSGASSLAGYVKEISSSSRRVLSATMLIGAMAGIMGGLFYLFGKPWPAVIFFLAIFVVENIRKPVGIAALGETVDSSVLASVLSVESQGETLFTALFALIMGFSSHYLSLSAGLFICSGVLVAGGILMRTECTQS